MDNMPGKSKPRVAITMGDPSGVGPEILVKAFASGHWAECCTPVVIGSTLALRRALEVLGAKLTIRELERISDVEARDGLDLIQIVSPRYLSAGDMAYGQPSRGACEAVIEYIRMAAAAASHGEVDAICTCPIHKGNLHRHGFAFPGHTEFLQELTQASSVVMMLAGPRLRVALVTIHHALAEVPGLVDEDRLETTIRITGEALVREFGLVFPRVAVAALNPHAGEEGKFGLEEIHRIGPVIQRFRDTPYSVSGPYAADTLFFRACNGEFDAVVAMYHDQGLIPIKLIHFHDAVNVSLGLPIIRTSVDHGTAYDLAGSGRAHEGSLLAAIQLASSMACNRNKSRQSPP